MAREIVAFCDHHTDTTGERVPGLTRQLDIGQGPRQVEICDDCYDELITPLEKLLAAHGRDVSATGDSQTALHCIWCRVTRKTVRGLQDHVNTEHPENAHAFIATLTMQGRKASGGPASKAVEEVAEHVVDRRRESRRCGFEEPDGTVCERVLESPQGWGQHRRAVHGILGMSDAAVANRRAKGK